MPLASNRCALEREVFTTLFHGLLSMKNTLKSHISKRLCHTYQPKYSESDHVRIKEKNITGSIINVYMATDGKTMYLIEADEEGPIDDPDAWNDVRFPQFDCYEDEIEPD